jgi:hypothetical protein
MNIEMGAWWRGHHVLRAGTSRAPESLSCPCRHCPDRASGTHLGDETEVDVTTQPLEQFGNWGAAADDE